MRAISISIVEAEDKEVLITRQTIRGHFAGHNVIPLVYFLVHAKKTAEEGARFHRMDLEQKQVCDI